MKNGAPAQLMHVALEREAYRKRFRKANARRLARPPKIAEY